MRSQFTENTSPIETFEELTVLEELIEMIINQSNLCTQQNGRTFEVDRKEMKAFLGIIYIMTKTKKNKQV